MYNKMSYKLGNKLYCFYSEKNELKIFIQKTVSLPRFYFKRVASSGCCEKLEN